MSCGKPNEKSETCMDETVGEQKPEKPDWFSPEERLQTSALRQLGFVLLSRTEDFSYCSQELGIWATWKFLVPEGEAYQDATCLGALFSKYEESKPDFGKGRLFPARAGCRSRKLGAGASEQLQRAGPG